MKICKYCKKPISDNDVWNPDQEGNGYHHACLCEMEFRSRDKQIYDKGRAEVLDKIRAYIDHIRNTGMGKKKSLEFIEKFVDGLKCEIVDKEYCDICEHTKKECVGCYPELGYKNNKAERDTKAIKEFEDKILNDIDKINKI